MIYDAIVLGTGGVGSAALFHLAQRGARVLGLDRFPGGHDRGSSHGETRIIRQAYFEHSDYVPLLHRAYELWADLEKSVDQRLFFQVGLLQVGPAEGVVVPGVLKSAHEHGLDVQTLTPTDVAKQFPGFQVPQDLTAVFEKKAGYLLVEKCVLAHLAMAQQHGAELRSGVDVLDWISDRNTVTVETSEGRFVARQLVISAGAWSGGLLRRLGVSLQVRRKHVHWFEAKDQRYHEAAHCPTFLFEMQDGCFYGFPQRDSQGVKVAEHSGGVEVSDPLADDRSEDIHNRTRVESFIERCMPGVTTRQLRHSVCYYTMSFDEHFLVDRVPDHPRAVFAAGLSGHGFKFTSVLGQALADLALEGATTLPIGFLHHRRAKLQ